MKHNLCLYFKIVAPQEDDKDEYLEMHSPKTVAICVDKQITVLKELSPS